MLGKPVREPRVVLGRSADRRPGSRREPPAPLRRPARGAVGARLVQPDRLLRSLAHDRRLVESALRARCAQCGVECLAKLEREDVHEPFGFGAAE